MCSVFIHTPVRQHSCTSRSQPAETCRHGKALRLLHRSSHAASACPKTLSLYATGVYIEEFEPLASYSTLNIGVTFCPRLTIPVPLFVYMHMFHCTVFRSTLSSESALRPDQLLDFIALLRPQMTATRVLDRQAPSETCMLATCVYKTIQIFPVFRLGICGPKQWPSFQTPQPRF